MSAIHEALNAQHWARHWHDVARLARTDGARLDAQRLAAGHYARARELMGLEGEA